MKHSKREIEPIKPFYNDDLCIIEIGVDEVGRGPLFGRVYAAAVILPKDNTLFDYIKMKDSKRFHSDKKINQTANYIRENALAWSVEYSDEKVIDEINILQATQLTMHQAIKNVLKQVDVSENTCLLIDGNYFNPLTINGKVMPHITIENGDNKYASIAAASILAKVERDKYIEDLCITHPELIDKYALNTNKGYGSKKHMDGIKQHGITPWHRKSFGICKSF
jgi:ribonuclease HII